MELCLLKGIFKVIVSYWWFKTLTYILHKQPMGRDVGETSNVNNPEWEFPYPKSADETVLREVCSLYK